MDHVDAHIAWSSNANERVHVRAIHVNEATCVMNDLTDLLDVSFEQAQRVRIGEHQSGDVALRTKFAQVIEISQTFSSRLNRLH